ncbi:MAG: hypothetical protein IJN56_07425 [Clostridia bacterium]|nr:hypothetical protein [Clostridia bacterium]
MDFSKLKDSIKSKAKEVAENENISKFASSLKQGIGDLSSKAKEAGVEYKKNMAEHKALTDEAKAPIDGCIISLPSNLFRRISYEAAKEI